MTWIYLVIAGLLEVVWAYFMKQSAGFTRLVPSIITIVSMLASFGLLSLAMRTLPLGSAYTIWTGIGAVGAFILGVLLLGENIDLTRVLASMLIVAGIVLMKFSSKNRAAISLGIPKTTLDRYINLKNFTVYSPVLEMDVYLIDPSKSLSEDSPSYTTTDGVMTISEVDLYALEKGKLFALLLDKKSLFGIYNNPSQAAKSLDDKSDSRYISRYINLERPVVVGQDKTPVYFVMNPD